MTNYSQELIQQYANIALDVYYDLSNPDRAGIAPDWTRVASLESAFHSTYYDSQPTKLGFAAYNDGNTWVVAFDGWEDPIYRNLLDERLNAVLNAIGVPDPFFIAAVTFAHFVAAQNGIDPSTIQYVGHSQGGGVAAAVAAYFGADAFVFNPAMTTYGTSLIHNVTKIVIVKSADGEILFSYPTLVVDVTSEVVDTILDIASELFPEYEGLTADIVYPSVLGGGVIDGLRVSGDIAGALTPWGAITDFANIELGIPPLALATYHGMNFMRFVSYLGKDPENPDKWWIETLDSDLRSISTDIVDADLFVYKPGDESINPQSDNPDLNQSEAFLRRIINDHLAEGELFAALKDDLKRLHQSVKSGDDGLEVRAYPLAILALQLSNKAVIDGNLIRLFSEGTNSFSANIARLPLAEKDGADLSDIPGLDTLVNIGKQELSTRLDELGVDAVNAVAAAVGRVQSISEGKFSGVVAAADASGFQNAIAFGDTPNSSYGTLFLGSIGADVAIGGSGNDFFAGGDGGVNKFDGGKGDDVIVGGKDKDELLGGDGNDVIVDEGGNGNLLDGGKGDDVIVGRSGKDELIGGEGNDKIWAAAGEDKLYGDDDEDELHGGGDKDELYGGKGKDKLFGDDGKDILDGGEDEDELTGGEGGDIFIVDDGDRILDPENDDRAEYKGTTFVHGEKENDSDNYYKGDSGEKYYQEGESLKIVTEDGATIYVDNWAQEKLGITLDDDPDDDDGSNAENYLSPLVLDLDGDGVEVTSLKGSTAFFDLDNDGMAERTAWVTGGDGLLALDRNKNGTIDSQSELFGAGLEAGRGTSRDQWDSGFAKLIELDGNRDGVININDAKFADLRIWVDANGDGRSEAGELFSLGDLGIKSISVGAQSVAQQILGNPVSDIGSFERVDGSLGTVADVWFRYDPEATRSSTPISIDPAVSGLPNLAGSGQVNSLHAAMSADPALREMVESLASMQVSDLASLSARVEQILLRWTGADQVNVNSRDQYIDARILTAIESFTGLSWRRASDNSPNPRWIASAQLVSNWNDMVAKASARLLAQIPVGQQVLPGLQDFGLAFLSFGTPITLDDAIASIAANAPVDGTEKLQYWHSMILVLDSVQASFPGYMQQRDAKLDAALTADGVSFTSSTLRRAVIGDARSSSMRGTFYDDVIVGGVGNDAMEGGSGDDVYWIGRDQGFDVIQENDRENKIRFAPGITFEDLTFTENLWGVTISIAGSSGQILILNGVGIREFIFDDGSTVDLASLDLFVNKLYGSDLHDVLGGTPGDHLLEGGAGNDAYLFGIGSGQDRVNEIMHDGSIAAATSTADEIRFGPGITPSDIVLSRGGYEDFDLVIGIAGHADQLTILGQYRPDPKRVERFVFADGTVWSHNDVLNFLLTGTSANDRLVGDDESNVLNGGGGNDILIGRGGNDTYHFGLGNGQDRIVAGDGDNAIVFGAGIAASDLIVRRGGIGLKDVIIQIRNTADVLTLSQYSGASGAHVNSITFQDGTVWTDADLFALIPPMSGTPLDDYLAGGTGDDLLDGGAGNDELDGGAGNDTYVFGRGYGEDYISNEYDDSGSADVVEFSAGVVLSDLLLSTDGYNLFISIVGTFDQLTISSQFFDEISVHNGIEHFRFADGTTLTSDDVRALLRQSTPGDDTIYGTAGHDEVLDGGAGNDTIISGYYDTDTILFGRGSGYDRTIGSYGDIVQLGADISIDDLVLKKSGDGFLIEIKGTSDKLLLDHYTFLPDGKNFLFADGDTLTQEEMYELVLSSSSTDGDDNIEGFSGRNDILDGGSGNDRLTGSGGGDVFRFGLGYGHDVVSSGYSTDVVEFGAGIQPEDILVTYDGEDVVLSIIGTDDKLRIQRQFTMSFQPGTNSYRHFGISTFTFANGAVWTSADIQQRALTVGDADDLLIGTAGADVLAGGKGDDLLRGLGGNDTYVFNIGDGADVIVEADDGALGNTDKIVFGSGIAVADVQFRHDADVYGLEILVGTGGDKITIPWGSAWGHSLVERFEFEDGTILTIDQVRALIVAEMSTDGDDVVEGFYDSPARLDGGKGNDILTGHSNGGDVYVFGPGYGQDVIDSPYMQSNSVEFLAGILPADVIVRREEDPENPLSEDAHLLVLYIRGTTDKLTIKSHFGHYLPGISTVSFADGTTWSAEDLNTLALASASVADDLMVGGSGNDVLDGKGGQDYLAGGFGNDTYVFGRGYGADTLVEQIPDHWDTGYNNTLDVIQFLAGVGPSDIEMSLGGENYTDLIIRIIGTNDSLSIRGQFSAEEPVIEKFEFADGTIWAAAQIRQSLIVATSGDDIIVDVDANETTIDGGAGNDILVGRDGSDAYLFGRGSGVDVILDDESEAPSGETAPEPGYDVVQFGVGIVVADLLVTRTGEYLDDLVIQIKDTDDRLVIKGGASSGFDTTLGIEEFHFADGPILLRNQMILLAQGVDDSGDNTISEDGSGKALDGGAGNDQLFGGSSNTTYIFDGGYGSDIIEDAGGGLDVVLFGENIPRGLVAFFRAGENGEDLRIEVDGLELLTLTIKGQFSDATNKIEEFHFSNGDILSWTDVQQSILQAARTDGADAIAGFASADQIDGGAGDDQLTGGAGNDSLLGGIGHDTAVYAGKSSDYEIIAKDGVTTIRDLNAADGDEGLDTLVEIESVKFLGDNNNVTISVGNLAPVLIDDAVSGVEDQDLVIARETLLANDTDAEGDALIIVSVANVVGGTAWVNLAGGVTFRPQANFNGTASFTYAAIDGQGGQSSATVNVMVTAVNDAPTAQADVYQTNEDTILVVTAAAGLLGNDLDVDGDALSAILLTGPQHGVLNLNLDGSFTYSPDQNYYGPDSFTYAVEDGNGGSVSASVALTVGAVNDAPVAMADTGYTTANSEFLSIALSALLENDSDEDGDNLSLSNISNVVGGAVYVDDGAVIFVPTIGYVGSGGFNYSVSDGKGGVSMSTVSIDILLPTTENNAPASLIDANVASNRVIENAATGTVVGITALATDPDAGDTLTYSLSDDAAGRFQINPTTGIVTVANGGLLDVGQFTQHMIVIRATDSEGLFREESFVINVTESSSAELIVATAAGAQYANVTILENGNRLYIWNEGSSVKGRVLDENDLQVGAILSLGSAAGKVNVIALENGGFVTSSISGSVLTVTRYTSSGAPDGAPQTITGLAPWSGAGASNGYGGYNYRAEIGLLDDGSYVVTWYSAGIDGSNDGIGAQLFNADGTPLGAPFQVNTATAAYQMLPSVTSLGNGNFLIAWQDSSVGPYRIKGQIFTNAGVKVGGELTVTDATSSNQGTVSVSSLSNGGFVATWFSLETVNGSAQDVYVRVFDASGQPIGSASRANSTLLDYQWNPMVTVLSDDSFVVTWQGYTSVSGSYDIFAQRYDAQGDKVGDELLVNTTTLGDQRLPSIVATEDGGFVVAWESSDGTIRSKTFYGSVIPNQAPVTLVDIDGTANEVAENAVFGTVVGITALASDPDVGDTLTYSLSDDAGGRFQIDAQTGVVSVVNGGLLDYEVATTHSITVVTTDADGLTKSETFSVAVTDINEAPISVSDADTANNSVAENAVNGTVVGITALASDPDAGDALTYSLADNAGGRFQIDAQTGVVSVANGGLLDYESETTHSVTVVATDAAGLTSSETFEITVTDVNEAPETLVDSDAAENEVAENAATGTMVGITALAGDPDAGDALTYSLSDDAGGRFQIDASTGIISVANGNLIDYESASSHSITVIATDTGGLTKSEAFSITVTDVNEAPTAITLSNEYVVENIAGAEIGTLTVFDPDMEDSHSLSVSDIRFEIVGGKLKLKSGVSLDFEVEPSVLVTVTATDSGALSKAQSFTINVVNAAEQSGPGADVTVASGGSRSSVTLLSDGRQLVTWLTSGGAKGRYYNTAGVALGTEFSLGTAVGFSAVASQPSGGFVTAQVGTSGQLRVQRYDSSNQPIGTAWTLSASVVNSTYGYAIYQDRISVTSYPDGSYIVVWGASGADANGSGIAGQKFDSSGAPVGGVFPINTLTSGNQSLADVIALTGGGFVAVWSDYGSNNGDIRGQVYDAQGQQIGTSSFLINTATAADQFAPALAATSDGGFVAIWQSYGQDLPSDWGVYGQRYDAAGQKVGNEFLVNTTMASNQYHAQVAGLTDGGFAVVWYSTTNAGVYGQRYDAAGQKVGGEFNIDTPGAGGSEPFVAALPGGGFVVSWTASGGVIHTRTFGVTNTNASPFNLIDVNSAENVAIEESAAGILVGISALATDADLGDTLIYSLTDNAGGRFTIDAVTGVVSVANGALIDFETATSHSITVKATDAGGLFVTRQFVIQVLDGNDAPTQILLSAAAVAENDAGAVVGTLSAIDPNVGDTYTLNVSDNRFEIVDDQLKLKAGVSLDYEAGANVNVTVTATDSGGLSKAQTFAIAVSNVNEAPVSVGLSNLTVSEFIDGAEIGDLTVVDPDAGDTHTFGVSDSRFEVIAGKLKLKAGVTLDLAAEAQVALTVTATDAGGLSKTESFTIDVTPFNSVVTISNGVSNPTAVTGAQSGNTSAVTVLPDGRQLVTWIYNNSQLRGRFLNAAGQTLGAEIDLGAAPGNSAAVAALAGGGFVVARQTNSGISVQHYDAAGVAVGTAWTRANGNPPSVTVLSDGSYVVTWHATSIDAQADSYGIGGQRFAADGTAVGPVFRVNTSSANHQTQPDIVALSGGGFVVVWTDGSAGNNDVRGQLYDAVGNQLGGGEFLINSGRTDTQQVPAVTALADGGFMAVWESRNGQDGDSVGIYGRRYTAQGVAVGGEFLVNTTTAGSQEKPQLAGLTDGGYVVVWTSAGSVYAQRFDATNAKVGTEFQVAAAGANPNIAALPNGGFTISYMGGNDTLVRQYGPVSIDYGGHDGLVGGAGNDVLDGKAGNDTLIGGLGNDTLIGGLGNDVAVFSGRAVDYTVTDLGNGQVQVTDLRAGAVNEGTDTLTSVEQLRFLGDLPSLSASNPTAVTGAQSGNTSAVTVLPDGRQLVTWIYNNSQLRGRFLNAAGQTLGAEIDLGAAPGNSAAVAALAGGGFVVARQTNSGISVQHYDAAGVAVGTAWTRANGNPPSVTVLSDGSYVVTWHATSIDAQADSYGIGGQRFAADGTAVGPVFRVNTSSANHQTQPDIVALSGGGFVVVWTDGSAGNNDVRGQLYDAVGNQLGGGEFLINSGRTDTQQVPAVTALADGGFMAVWESRNGQDGDSVGIYGRRYTAQGVAVGGEFLVNTTTAGSQEKPQLAGLTDGGYVVVWTSAGSVYAQRFDATNAKVGTEFQVAAAGANPNIAALPNGGFTISYTGSSNVVSTRTYSDGAMLAGGDGADTLVGTSTDQWFYGAGGNDTLDGGAGNDVLNGGAGDDTLLGGLGADRYEVGRGTGQDLIQTGDASSVDVLDVGSSVATDQLWFSRDGDDLIVAIIGTNDRSTVDGWYAADGNRLGRIEVASGAYIAADGIEQLVEAMASFSPPPVGTLNIDGVTRQALAPVLAANWQG
ncbi:calcium-binding protein [Dongia sp.]|uniref:calcium-binding protein n=1 Tax=Dongia sp. TaxID=1977262 RepID=UPI0035B45456